MSFLTKWAWDIGAGLAILGLCLFAGYLYGDYKYHLGIMSVRLDDAKQVTKTISDSSAATTKYITEYIPKVQYIKGETVTITKEVPVYVTKQDDQHCTVPVGFVSLWNASNKMQLPASSASVPRGASPVILSDIAAEHTKEAGICLANEARIDAMRGWLKAQQAVYAK